MTDVPHAGPATLTGSIESRAGELSSDGTSFGRLAVVIANYNHRDYVGQAIESALALRWHDLEVVVVDDGSTDDSLQVIQHYADRVTVLATENATQRVAANRGFSRSTGDVVIFLDADDVLPPELPQRLAEVWGPHVSKVQFQAQPIGTDGRPLAVPYPSYDPPPSARQITRWARSTSAYPTPPGSANAYARWYLDMIFPLPPSIGLAADSGCLAVAPHVGAVVSVAGTTIGYRWTPHQLSDLFSKPDRFRREIGKARGRWRLAQATLGVAERDIDDRPLFRSRELVQFRVAARRSAAPLERADPPLPGDSLGRLWWDVARSPFHPGPEQLRTRLAIAAWCGVTLLAPTPLVMPLLRLRYRRRGI